MRVPILRLKDVLLTSIQIDLSDDEIVEFQTDVLRMVSETAARGIVIDITALEVVDSFMARSLNDTASMAQLLGAEAVICGMQPAVALTLVEMGRELIGAETALDLDQGMEKLQSMIRKRDAVHGTA